MRIVHISCVAPPEGGGIGSVAYREVFGLCRLGADAVLIAPEPLPGSISNIRQGNSTGITEDYIVRLPAWRIGNAARLRGLERFLADADVVHLHYPFYFTAGTIARLRRSGKIKKLVLTLHMDARSDGLSGLMFDLHRSFFQKKILDSADLLLVSTMDYACHSSFAPWADDQKMHELPFGVDTDVFCPSASSAKAELGIPEGARTIGTLSVMDRAHPFKGVDVLLQAAAKLPKDVHVLLVGDGDKRAQYEKLAEDLMIGSRVRFLGSVDRDKLIKALQSMDVFAFPSTSGAEAFGLAMLEAMACGVPVVASDLPGVRQVAEGAGAIVKPGDVESLADGLRRLLADEESRRDFASAARDKALSYNWQTHNEKLIGFYKGLCA